MILTWDKRRLEFMRDASQYNAGYYTALWNAVLGKLPSVPQNICDAGCGAGYLSLEMAKCCQQVTAVDLSADATAFLRENSKNVGNLTVKTGDISALPPEMSYDAMVFCYFGKVPEILRIAKAQCRGTLVIVTRDYTHHRFSLHPTAFERDTVVTCRSALEQAGLPYTFSPFAAEFGQPFRSLDAAVEFFTLYGQEPVREQDVLPRLQTTGSTEFPYYFPTVKKMGLFTARI